jgi:hypothetical protein
VNARELQQSVSEERARPTGAVPGSNLTKE